MSMFLCILNFPNNKKNIIAKPRKPIKRIDSNCASSVVHTNTYIQTNLYVHTTK